MGNRKAREFMQQHADASAWDSVQSTPRDVADDVCLPGIGLRRLQLVVAPALEPGYGWEARSLGSLWRLFRSDVVHEPDSVRPRLRGYLELEVNGEELQGIVHRLRSVSLPISPLGEDSGGSDGTTYQVALSGNAGSEARFRWWEAAPPAWRSLEEIVGEMIARFTSWTPKPS